MLDIRKNDFKSLPETIQFYTDLRKLNVSHNHLVNLGGVLRNCELLEEIWAQVSSFPVVVSFTHVAAMKRSTVGAGELESRSVPWSLFALRNAAIVPSLQFQLRVYVSFVSFLWHLVLMMHE